MSCFILVFLLLIAPPTWAKRLSGDLNGDGRVNFADFLLFSRNFGRTDGTPFNPSAGPDTVYVETDCKEPDPDSEPQKPKVGVYSIYYPDPDQYSITYPVPNGVEVVRSTSSEVRISWQPDKTGRVFGYGIERSPHPISRAYKDRVYVGVHIDEVSSDSTAFTVGPLLSDTKYKLKIYAMYRTRGLPQYSRAVTIDLTVPVHPAPGAPVLVLLGWEDRQTALITWSIHPLITAYRIFKDGEPISPWWNPNVRYVALGGLQPYTRYEIIGKAKQDMGPVHTGKPLVLCLNCN